MRPPDSGFSRRSPVDPPGQPTELWRDRAQWLQASVQLYAGSPAGPALDAALKALAAGAYAKVVHQTRKALKLQSNCALAWRLQALALEGQGDAAGALAAYEAAHALDPDAHDLLADLGRLAIGLGMDAAAVQLFARALEAEPHSAHLTAQLAQALRGCHQYDQAITVLRRAIEADNDNALLWNALGSVMLQQGDADNALIFFEQALALAPDYLEALYNRASARLERGDPAGALADCHAAMARAAPDQQPAIRFVRALTRLSLGDLAGGWADYEARLDADFAKATVFRVPARRWTPQAPLTGRRLLVVGEQGLGDEIMFAGLIPDVIEALGPHGALSLAVEPRLVTLLQRAFPQVEVRPHATPAEAGRRVRETPFARGEADLWAPMASLAQRFRPDLASFGDRQGYLAPDPDKAAFWRDALAATGDQPKVGVVWKSMNKSGDRLKQYAPFEAWIPVLRTPGLQFVNLQYGDCGAELEQARSLGIDIWDPPGLDLLNDIDGAAALSAALNLLLGVGNASTNLAAACGVPVWISVAPAAWPRLGQPAYPWFPRSRVFAAERFGGWDPVMSEIAEALSAYPFSPQK